jgi:hypothetical protein
MIDEGNKTFGGLKKTCTSFGILGNMFQCSLLSFTGFVRFLNGYYLLLISKRKKVGEIGGHFVYSVDDTAYIYIPHPSVKVLICTSELMNIEDNNSGRNRR